MDPNYLCQCYKITEQEVIQLISKYNPGDLCDFSKYCLASLGCGSCREIIEDLIEENISNNDEKI